MAGIANRAAGDQGAPVGLVGRNPESAALSRLLDDARQGRGGALALRGEPGSGRTAQCHQAVALAPDFRVVSVAGAASEQGIAFSGLSRLCRAAVDDGADLAPRHAQVIQWLIAGGMPLPGADVRRAAAAGVLSLLGTVSRGRPALIVLDDFHWLDAPSVEALCFVARRLADVSVALLLTVADSGETEPDLAGIPVRWLAPLSPSFAGELLQAVAETPPHPAVTAEVIELTGGNPAALVEMATRLPPEQLSGQRPLPRPLPLGPRLAAGFARPLEGLPRATRTALALVAASTGARSEVEAGLASLGLARGDLDLAEEAGVLTVGGARVDLAHPLLGSAAYQTVPVAERAGIRRVLATEEARAPRVRLPVDAEAGNDTWTVELLGGFAVRRGGDDVTPTANHSAQAIKLVALKGPLTVDELVDGLWPEAAEGVGRVRLRNVLNRVRVTCGPVLVRDGDLVRLTRGTSVDALRFEEAAAKALVALGSGEDGAAGRALAAVEAYTGELLPADRYVAWASAPRERLSRRYLELLDTLAEESERAGDLGATVRLLELGMDLDPYDESRYVRAARLLAEHGRRAAALSLLHQARVVAEELGVPLSAPAERLVESLGAGTGRAKASISTST